ncbi:MBL fold metallo-hydrolase [Streptococcus sp.]|uniref:MBL fold metallo-hydrolase n=1 Tax=Streptococcus sp. TaxID=1306 RepID=UPI001D5E67DB|nr:MBL fold metallo-hydrolase [Streptococcus sp.]MBS6421288.1 MBL fold metallo-hydrolase [Streptococcus sp.]
MESRFKLWPVGQGLFYSGTIKYKNNQNFNFVYDCGSSSKNIDKIVDSYVKTSLIDKTLDMLVISHFDEDHISGIPKLLTEVKKIKKIFIPYKNGIENYLLFLAFIYGNDGNINEKVDEIILVNSTESENENNRDFEELNTSIEIEDSFSLPNIKVGVLNDSSIKYRNFWKFKFYNTYLRKTDLTSKIKEEIKTLIKDSGCKGLEELLKKLNSPVKNDENCDKEISVKNSFKIIYEKYCSSSYGNSKQNQSSLCLYHSPLLNNENTEISIYYHLGLIFGSLPYYFFRDIGTKPGTLLTGDISLKQAKRYNDFKKHYENEHRDVLYFLTPHHGSSKNWNKNVLVDFPMAYFYLNSAGFSNKFDHPSDSVVGNIIKSGRYILNSNEIESVEYSIYL